MDNEERIKLLPAAPGVYIMKDETGAVLYVGKAGNLRKRVTTYFQKRRRLPERLVAMTSKVADISYIPTSTEAEALIYENSLIKRLSPRYNVALRDDKSYPMLKLTVNEPFPRLFVTRKKIQDRAKYYGPYSDAKLLRKALVILRQMFPLRNCVRMPKKICLDYHIKQCVGPCAGKADKAGYDEIVSELKLFLEGRSEELLKALAKRMLEASGKEDFEEASRLKNRIETLGSIKEDRISYGARSELEELKNVLGMEKAPQTIEAFDVSNIMGKEAVGSMIYFYRGHPKKTEYRKFRIKTVSAIDDYAMIKEIVRRRYERAMKENRPLPDLILIDGGKGHLGACVEELQKLGISRIPAAGIAKEFEHIYVEGRKDPIILPKESKALHLLKRVRDEAHRFAISYHKSLRSKGMGSSELDAIEGVGEKRKKALINHFGSVDRIKEAKEEDLLKVEGIDERTAKSIIAYFKK